MQALVDASPSFRELVDRIKAENPDTKLDKNVQFVLFWFSSALIDEAAQKDLSNDTKDTKDTKKQPYERLVADVEREMGGKGRLIRKNYTSDEERKLLETFPELEGSENKSLLMALISVEPAFQYVKKYINKTSGLAVADVVERLQTHVRDAFVKQQKTVRSVVHVSLASRLKSAMENYAKILKTSSSSGDAATTISSSGTTSSKAGQDPGGAAADKIRAVQKQQFTGAVTRDFMMGLADTGSKDLQQMLGGIDARAKELAAHTMSVTFLLTESFRTFSDLLSKVNPGRVLREYEQIVYSLEPIAPNERQKAAAALELERAYAETRQEIEEEFVRMQDRVALALERVDNVRAEALGSQYTWDA